MADPVRTAPRRPDEPTYPTAVDRPAQGAERLLEAVIHLLVEDGTEVVAGALTPEQVARRAGMSRSTYYRVDGPGAVPRDRAGRRAVLEAALRHVLEASATDLEQVAGTLDQFVAGADPTTHPQDVVRSIIRGNLEMLGQHEFRAQMLAAALTSSSGPISTALGTYYRAVTDEYRRAYEQALRHIGYRIRAPFTVEDFTVALMAMAEGLAMRRSGDHELDLDRCVDMMEAVVDTYLVRQGDLADHNGLMVQPSVTPSTLPTRSSVLEAATHLFGRERAAVPTITEIADAAGCTETTVRTLFGGVVGVVRAAWDEWVPEFHETVERNRSALQEPDPMTLLYRAMLSVANRAAEQRSLTRALLTTEIGIGTVAPSANGGDEAISHLFEQLLREAFDRGDVAPPRVGDETGPDRCFLFAQALRTTLLHLVVSAPAATGTDTAAHARWCVDYVWALMMPTRRPGVDGIG